MIQTIAEIVLGAIGLYVSSIIGREITRKFQDNKKNKNPEELPDTTHMKSKNRVRNVTNDYYV